ncbi:hypothetical protein [Ralstonia pseudosolanacearum]|uniref:hypothetical protein n=1 Tax=Ralstonia pseudosolanacearum TaxID=1310165 RepID=UPI001160A36D|nr:hypothetical protein [Ralstonia pseudosolanacearum]QWF61532.1 hypothetical protein KM864_02705 [Ralstonia solanacearum]
MTQPQQNHTVQDLLAFYDRVNPVLSKWLIKPAWTAEETALLCAGFIPNDNNEVEAAAASDIQESSAHVMPCDPDGYLPADYELYDGYLHLLAGKGAGAPRDMVDMLRPAITWEMSKLGQGATGAGAPSLRVLTLDSLENLQWLLIIGNAVGLNMPAVIPFGLLNGLRDRLVGPPVPEAPTNWARKLFVAVEARIAEKKGIPPSIGEQASNTEPAAEATPGTRQRKPRGHPPVPTTSETRGYHTTEEVAGHMRLATDTLNKYARKGIVVDGFTPFKRQNGRSWQWRDAQQQAEYEGRAEAGQAKRKRRSK